MSGIFMLGLVEGGEKHPMCLLGVVTLTFFHEPAPYTYP